MCTLAALPVPAFTAHVVDEAGFLEPNDRARLESKLATYERDSGHQLALLIVPSLQGEVLEDYAVRVFDQWKLG